MPNVRADWEPPACPVAIISFEVCCKTFVARVELAMADEAYRGADFSLSPRFPAVICCY